MAPSSPSIWRFATGRASIVCLILDGGPFVLPEHVQNLPVLGLNVPGATTIQDLRNAGNFGADRPRNEVWGLLLAVRHAVSRVGLLPWRPLDLLGRLVARWNRLAANCRWDRGPWPSSTT